MYGEKRKPYLLLKYPIYEYNLEEVKEIYQHVKDCLPEDITLIAIPHDWTWEELSYDDIMQLKKMIDIILENKES